ncbi:type II toxin-antitoxin system ParD family antitoxin [Hoeflea ulvae]|uniref:Type II toxin-antitoxin system ParD family antitoxin n=1 Tax=Hoeflea ulvae TaxID=2983764 RepID=A0ABT3YB19_9HYPH|nr:type II toxin-antitoxin system ParD family antitoxin [Hoeflea ulvae]MCY0092997.1 type II toxin-antitoxin system ParD family antitoxin [Hoeflea ulvae]
MDKRTISLPNEHADYIDQKVNSGDYASASEVVRAGLRALQERDRAIEEWLRNQVAPAHDAMLADPSRGIPAQSVFDDVRERHAQKTNGSR